MPSVSPAPGQATSPSANTASSPGGLARDRRYHGADAAFQCHPPQNSGDRPLIAHAPSQVLSIGGLSSLRKATEADKDNAFKRFTSWTSDKVKSTNAWL
jgi:hypothetical protein